MTPVLTFVLFMANMLAFTIALSVLIIALAQRPNERAGHAVVQFVASLAFYNFLVMLTMAVEFLHGPLPLFGIVSNLSITGFALCVVSAFSMVITLAGLMKQALQVFARAGIVMVLVLQWPIWSGQLFTSDQPYQMMSSYTTTGIVVACAALGYIIATLYFAFRYRAALETLTTVGIAILLLGETFVLIDPNLRAIGFASLVSVLANSVLGYQITRIRLFNPLRMQKAQLAALRDVSRSLIGPRDLQKVMHVIVQEARQMLNADMAVILIKDAEDAYDLSVMAQDGGGMSLTGRKIPVGEGLNGRVFVSKKAFRLANYHTWENTNSRFADVPIHAAVSVPLIYDETVVGVLNVSELKRGRQFSERDQATLEMIAPQAALALVNAQLRARVAELEIKAIDHSQQ
jgi:hypothetical protein